MKTLAICLSAAALIALIGAGFGIGRAFAKDGSDDDKVKNQFDPMNTVWVTRDKSNKITVEDGTMHEYFFNKGKYHLMESGKAEKLNSSNEYVTGSDESPLGGYWSLRIKDKLMIASLNVTDSPTITLEFAREGHEEDFPPLPVYAKDRDQIAIKELDSLTLAIGNLSGIVIDPDYRFAIPDAWKNVSEIYIDVKRDEDGGALKFRYIETYSENDGAGKDSLNRKGVLTQEQAAELFAIATDHAILPHNPYRDMDGMNAPVHSNQLIAKFKSGESISIDSSHGFVYDIKAAERFVEFFRGLNQTDEDD